MRLKLLCCAVVLAVATSANAIMIKMSTADLVGHASLIIAGKVEETTALPPDEVGMIYTDVKVRVNDVVHGATTDDVITVRVMGGEYGDLGVAVEDQPTFTVGENVILFLAPAEGGRYICPDAFQGKYTVVDGTVLPVGVTLDDFLAEIARAASR